MNKKNKSKLESLLKKVANENDLEIYGVNIQTNQNPKVIEIFIKKNQWWGYFTWWLCTF